MSGLTKPAKLAWQVIAFCAISFAVFYVIAITAAAVWNEGVTKFAEATGGHVGTVTPVSSALVVLGFLSLVKLTSMMWGKPEAVNVVNVKKPEVEDERG